MISSRVTWKRLVKFTSFGRRSIPVRKLRLPILASCSKRWDSTTKLSWRSARLMCASAPDSISYSNLVLGYTYLKRLDEARATSQEAISKGFDSPALRINLYDLSFLKSDAPGMAEQVSWAAGKPSQESVMLVLESRTAAYQGKLSKARELSRQAVSSAQHANDKQMAADSEASAAISEALYGNSSEAKQRAAASLAQLNGRDT